MQVMGILFVTTGFFFYYWLFLIVYLLIYLIFVLPFYFMGKRCSIENSWIVFIPIIQYYIIAKIAGFNRKIGLITIFSFCLFFCLIIFFSYKRLHIFAFIGFISLLYHFVLFIYLFKRIFNRFSVSGWFLLFGLIPVLGNLIILMMFYLFAFQEKNFKVLKDEEMPKLWYS